MKISVKRIIAATLSAAMITFAFAGCTGKSGTDSTSKGSDVGAGSQATPQESSNMTPNGEFPIVKEKVTLEMVAPGFAWFAPYEDMDFVKYYEEKTNVKVNFKAIPYETMKEKLNLMMTSGTYPDAFLDLEFGFSSSEIATYGDGGAFLALNDMIEKYGTNFKAAAAQYDKALEMVSTPDGKIYALPGFNDCLHCQYKKKMWLNQEWLTKLKLEMPSTTAEFEAVLQSFKDNDPNGNGKKDEIASMGWNTDDGSVAQFLLNAFTYIDGNTKNTPFWFLDNGKVTFAPMSEEYKQGVTWVNSLVKKGLIDPTSFTQDQEQIKQVTRDPNAVKVGAIPGFNIPGTIGNYNETEDHRLAQYAPMPVLKRPDGTRIQPSNTYSERVTPNKFVITNNCKEPEVAFRWADGWFTEENTIAAWVGMEGRSWNKPATGTVGVNGKPALFDRIALDAEAAKPTSMSNMLGDCSADIREGDVYDEADPVKKYAQITHWATVEAYQPYGKPEMTIPPLALTAEESTEVNAIATQLKDYVNENLALFCLGTKDITKDWDAYIKEFTVIGVEKLEKVYQTAYDRQYK